MSETDLISRQAAIDAMTNTLWHYPNECYRNLNEYEFAKGLAELGLKSVPSAQPEPLDEWCTDCKEYDKDKHCCPRWNRVIRQTLKDMKEEQPEIIRCKDCKNWHIDCIPVCEKHGCDVISDYTKPDDFCSWAERRTDD